MEKHPVIKHPKITDVESAVKIYWSYPAKTYSQVKNTMLLSLQNGVVK